MEGPKEAVKHADDPVAEAQRQIEIISSMAHNSRTYRWLRKIANRSLRVAKR